MCRVTPTTRDFGEPRKWSEACRQSYHTRGFPPAAESGAWGLEEDPQTPSVSYLTPSTSYLRSTLKSIKLNRNADSTSSLKNVPPSLPHPSKDIL